MPIARFICPSLVLLLVCGPLPGCKNRELSSQADDLRRRVLELENENKAHRLREAELRAELEREAARPDELPAEIRANMPRVAAISLNRLSHARDTDDDGRRESLMLYIEPKDGRGRFVQMVGHLSVHALLVPPDDDAMTLARVRLAPEALRAAYRSGVTGTHYLVELALELPDGESIDSCLVRVQFDDGLTGRTHETERTISLIR